MKTNILNKLYLNISIIY